MEYWINSDQWCEEEEYGYPLKDVESYFQDFKGRINRRLHWQKRDGVTDKPQQVTNLKCLLEGGLSEDEILIKYWEKEGIESLEKRAQRIMRVINQVEEDEEKPLVVKVDEILEQIGGINEFNSVYKGLDESGPLDQFKYALSAAAKRRAKRMKQPKKTKPQWHSPSLHMIRLLQQLD